MQIKKRDVIKIIVTIILTVLGQYGAYLQNGYIGIGGNVLIPLFCILSFWKIPELIKFYRD